MKFKLESLELQYWGQPFKLLTVKPIHKNSVKWFKIASKHLTSLQRNKRSSLLGDFIFISVHFAILYIHNYLAFTWETAVQNGLLVYKLYYCLLFFLSQQGHILGRYTSSRMFHYICTHRVHALYTAGYTALLHCIHHPLFTGDHMHFNRRINIYCTVC